MSLSYPRSGHSDTAPALELRLQPGPGAGSGRETKHHEPGRGTVHCVTLNKQNVAQRACSTLIQWIIKCN